MIVGRVLDWFVCKWKVYLSVRWVLFENFMILNRVVFLVSKVLYIKVLDIDIRKLVNIYFFLYFLLELCYLVIYSYKEFWAFGYF